MTYITEQSSEELRKHMIKQTSHPEWRNAFADRLWLEIQNQDKRIELLESILNKYSDDPHVMSALNDD
jgi:hypothetical protein